MIIQRRIQPSLSLASSVLHRLAQLRDATFHLLDFLRFLLFACMLARYGCFRGCVVIFDIWDVAKERLNVSHRIPVSVHRSAASGGMSQSEKLKKARANRTLTSGLRAIRRCPRLAAP